MKSNNKGFTVIDLMTVMGIIGLLASLAIPAFPKYKTRPLDSEAIAHLQHVYRACKGYWLNNGKAKSCSVTLASGPAYGYLQAADINITVSGGESTFSGTASHVDSANTYTINSTGSIR